MPHILCNTRCRPEQLILEAKGIVTGEKIHLCQLAFCQEAQGEVGGVAV